MRPYSGQTVANGPNQRLVVDNTIQYNTIQYIHIARLAMLAAVQDTHRVPRAPPVTIHTIQDKSTRGKEGKVRERGRRKVHARRLATPPTRVYPQPPHLPTARATKPAAKASPGVQTEASGSQRLLVPGALLRRGPSPTPPPGPATRAQRPQPARPLSPPQQFERRACINNS